MARKGPTEQWPSHGKPEFRKVWDAARDRQWTLEQNSSHHTFTLRCSTEECKLTIFSTGKGRESYANGALKKIMRCMHAPEATSSLAKATEFLDRAERLVDGVEAQQESGRYEELATREMFDNPEWREDEVDDWLQRADELAEEARILLDGLADSGVADVLDEAARSVTTAKTSLDELACRDPSVAAQRERVKNLRSRVHELRTLHK